MRIVKIIIATQKERTWSSIQIFRDTCWVFLNSFGALLYNHWNSEISGITLGDWLFIQLLLRRPVSAPCFCSPCKTMNTLNLLRCNLFPSIVRFLAIQLYHLFYSGLVSSHWAANEIHTEVQFHCNTLLEQLRGSSQICRLNLIVLHFLLSTNIIKFTTQRQVLHLSICFIILDLSDALQVVAELAFFLQYHLWIFAS